MMMNLADELCISYKGSVELTHLCIIGDGMKLRELIAYSVCVCVCVCNYNYDNQKFTRSFNTFLQIQS